MVDNNMCAVKTKWRQLFFSTKRKRWLDVTELVDNRTAVHQNNEVLSHSQHVI